jgi:hypothetical protein
MIPRSNPVIAPKNVAVIIMLGEDASLPPANKKPLYARHRGPENHSKVHGGPPCWVIVPRTDSEMVA